MTKFISIVTAIIMFIFPMLNIPHAEVDRDSFKTEYSNVFVHGFSGWGEYDDTYKVFPYWGVRNGDLMKYLNARGFDCHAASVAPRGSAWDRACELYAQLMGTVTDYGENHSKKCGHERFGKDYSDCRLIGDWSAEKKVNLFGHSFGGATVRLLAELMANGDESEKGTSGISPLFTGGKADWIYCIVTLSAPHNGTTAYCVDHNAVTSIVNGFNSAASVIPKFADNALYDMMIDNAMALNEKISTIDSIYYFSYACDGTYKDKNGAYHPDSKLIASQYTETSKILCSFTGTTPAGYVVDEKWLPNDGLVNTYSALAPIGAPSVSYDSSNVKPGIWNVMEIVKGDHTTLQGAQRDNFNGRIFWVDLLSMINSL